MYFFDTYAFMEVMKNNPKYKKFRKEKPVTTIFNIAELSWLLTRNKATKSKERINDFSKFLANVNTEDIDKAMQLRLKMKKIKVKLSITDSIGYIIAKKYQLKFLTGDNDFKNLPNVEFVK